MKCICDSAILWFSCISDRHNLSGRCFLITQNNTISSGLRNDKQWARAAFIRISKMTVLKHQWYRSNSILIWSYLSIYFLVLKHNFCGMEIQSFSSRISLKHNIKICEMTLLDLLKFYGDVPRVHHRIND